jgi:RNA polymerase sigma factor (sigma-70 family)
MSTHDSIQLLRAYAENGDEAAFRDLVGRYIDLVYSTALRRVGGDAELARDVTQTVFTDLARKAQSVREVDLLGGWLHRHTGYVASTMVRSEQRRHAREQEAATMNALENTSDPTWQQIAPVLDETIDVLDAADRRAILLRFFERRDFRFIGASLGVSDDAAQKRVGRAIDKLRELLGKKGVTLSAALLAGIMTSNAVTAAPAGLSVQVSREAIARVAAGVGLAVLLAKLLSPLAAKLAVAAVAIGAVAWFAWPDRTNQTGESANQLMDDTGMASNTLASQTSGSTAAAPGTAATKTEPIGITSNRLLLTIVSAETGQPVTNAAIDYWCWTKTDPIKRQVFHTSSEGICEIPVPRELTTRLILTSEADGFAKTRLEWHPERGETIPLEYTMRVKNAVLIGGLVVDADGNPVVNAEIGFGLDGHASNETFPQSDNFGWPYWIKASSDAQGRWELHRVGKEAVKSISATASHPDHVEARMSVSDNLEALNQLLASSYVFRMGRADTVTGIVVDTNAQPIANAKIFSLTIATSGRRETTTAADGTFKLTGCRPGKNLLSATAEGFSTTTIEYNYSANADPVRLVLQSGKLLRLYVVDPEGEPIPKASVWLDTINADMGQIRAQAQFSRQTGPDGRLEWDNAPDEELDFHVSAKGYMYQSDIKLRADGTEHVIKMSPALTISGTVRDESTGEPIPRFRVVTGWPNWDPMSNTTNAQWSTIDRFWLNFEGGKFRHIYEEPVIGGNHEPEFVFKFEAENYAPMVTRVVKASEKEVRFDVHLRNASMTDVTVLLPDGSPAASADIGLVSPGSGLNLVPGGFYRRNVQSGGSLLRTDEAGKFRLPPDNSIIRIVAAHTDGYGEANWAGLTNNPVWRLLPWSRLEGVCLSEGQALPDVELLFQYGREDFGSFSTDFTAFQTRTDSEGRFQFTKVPYGIHKVARLVRGVDNGQTYWTQHPLATVELSPGETTVVTVTNAPLPLTVEAQ